MEKLEYFKSEDIKFDENNIYFSKEKNIEKRITMGLTGEEAGIYLLAIMFLEVSKEEEYILEEDELFAVLDLDTLIQISGLGKDEFMNRFNSIVNKGYLEEVVIEGFEDLDTYLFLY